MAAGEKLKLKRDSILFDTNDGKKTGIVFFVASVCVHTLLFAGLVFFQNYKPPKPLPPVLQVDLVSFMPDPVFDEPSQSSAKSNADGIPLKTSKIKKTKKTIKHIRPDISLKTKPKNLKDLMAKKEKKKKPLPEKVKEKPKKEEIVKKEEKPKEDSQKALEKAREKLAKEIEEKNQEQIAQALARLKQGVKSRGESTARANPAGYAGAGKKEFGPIDLYNLVIESSIRQNWVFNDILANMDQNLKVTVLIKILKSGEIRDIIYETKSGNRYLDESAKRAIKKSNPLPPLPGNRRSYDLGLIFTPKGLK